MIINITTMVSSEVALLAPSPLILIQSEVFLRNFLGRVLVDLIQEFSKGKDENEPDLLKMLAFSNAQEGIASAAAVQLNSVLRRPSIDPSPSDQFLSQLSVSCEWNDSGQVLLFVEVAKEFAHLTSNLSTQFH